MKNMQQQNKDKRSVHTLHNGEYVFKDIAGREHRWHINSILGYGGSGIVYDASNPIFPAKHYALKEYLPLRYSDYVVRSNTELKIEDNLLSRWIDGKTQFLKELEMQRLLPSSNTDEGQLFHYAIDSFLANGTAYVVLETDNCSTLEEYVSVLHHLIKSNGCTDCSALATILRCFVDVCNATSQLHRIGYLHLDISDTNILINRKTATARLNDFASCLPYDNKINAVIHKDCVSYTEHFSPIEQKSCVRGNRNSALSPASDVYSICAVLYKCLFEHPYDASLPLPQEDETVLIPLCPILGSEQVRDIMRLLDNGLCGCKYRIQTAQALKKEIEKVLFAIEQLCVKQKGIKLGLLPSVSLAIGYCENFLQDCCFFLSKMQSMTIGEKNYNISNVEKELRILIPENVETEWKSLADDIYQRPQYSLYSVDGVRSFGIVVDVFALENEGTLRVIDIPLTLRSSFKTIDYLVKEGVCAKEEASNLKKQEVQTFLATISKQMEKDPIVQCVLRFDKLIE